MIDNKYKGLILITPAKNEEKNIELVIKSILNQSLKPNIWVIADDGSEDNTPNIIKKYSNTYEWIHLIKLNNSQKKRDHIFHVSEVYNKAAEYAINLSNELSIDYEYIGILDADIILEKDYFKKITYEFEKNQRLGIASGVIYNYYNKAKERSFFPRGGNRVIRKKCFFDIGGIRLGYSPDAVATALAIVRGWEVKVFEHIVSYTIRPTSSAEGLWRGYYLRGISRYHLGYSLLGFTLSSFRLLFSRRAYLLIPYFAGYLSCCFKKEKRSSPPEVIDFYRNSIKRWLKGFN